MYSMSVKSRVYINSQQTGNKRFGKQLILKVVDEVENGLSRKQACEQYGMAYVTICEWLGRYGSEEYQLSRRRVFSTQRKREIALKIEAGILTKKQACALLGIDRRLLHQWLTKYKQSQKELALMNSKENQTLCAAPQPDVNQELQQAKLKAQALEMMILIAEEEFKIPIRKKSGAKQLEE